MTFYIAIISLLFIIYMVISFLLPIDEGYMVTPAYKNAPITFIALARFKAYEW